MTGLSVVRALLKEWGPHVGYALAGAALGLAAVFYFTGDDDPPPKPRSAESRFVEPSSPIPARPQPGDNAPPATQAERGPAPGRAGPAPVEELRPPVPEPLPQAGQVAAWRQNAVAYAAPAGRPMIAVVIDDMGVDRRRTGRAIALPAPLTTAFLTYAEDLDEQTREAQRAGHELMVHVPMEPSGAYADPGPNVISTGLSHEEMRIRLRWALGRFSGYVGINNHMGSRFTADREAMTLVLGELRDRGLLFLDSRTTAQTVAAGVARDLGVPFAERHVFLDDDPAPEAVLRQLREAERIAVRDGYAVVIGHPKDATIAALRDWLPALGRRGFAQVPVSAVVAFRERQGR